MTEVVYVNIYRGTILLRKNLENIVWRLVGNLMMGKIDPSAYLYKIYDMIKIWDNHKDHFTAQYIQKYTQGISWISMIRHISRYSFPCNSWTSLDISKICYTLMICCKIATWCVLKLSWNLLTFWLCSMFKVHDFSHLHATKIFYVCR